MVHMRMSMEEATNTLNIMQSRIEAGLMCLPPIAPPRQRITDYHRLFAIKISLKPYRAGVN